MAFFPRSLYNTEAATSFAPFFRLLDDFDNSYSRQQASCAAARKAFVPTWAPKFDVRETGAAYELHGELPGVDKDTVHIEFSDPQTLIVRGKTERSYTTEPATPAASIEAAVEQPIVATTEEPEKAPSHQASVADEDDADSLESGYQDIASPEQTAAATPAAAAPAPTPEAAAPKKPVDNAKYWLTERSIGDFTRSFNFPSRVEQDQVSASFDNGILTIVVPKAKKHEARRIAVF